MVGESIRVLVADDQAAVREGLATLLDLTPGIEVVGQARDGAQALQLVAEHAPDVVLMDLHMPGVDGIAATERVTAEHPGTRVVVLTTYADDSSIQRALRAGALGYLTKDADRVQIARAVQAAANGQSVLDEAVQRKLVAALTSPSAAAVDTAAAVNNQVSLTTREAEVLRLIAAGKSNPEIARELFVSEATVKTHINHVFAKTGARDRAQAVRFAYQHGLADHTD